MYRDSGSSKSPVSISPSMGVNLLGYKNMQKFLEESTMPVNHRKEFRSISPHLQGKMFEEV
jgi:hypothetical protein